MKGVLESQCQNRYLAWVMSRARYVALFDMWAIEAHGPSYRRMRLSDEFRTGEARTLDLKWAPGALHDSQYGEWAYMEDATGGDALWAFPIFRGYTSHLSVGDTVDMQIRHDDSYWLERGMSLNP